MAKDVTPQPMPVTSMPDRVDFRDQRDMYQELKAGIKSGYRPTGYLPSDFPSVTPVEKVAFNPGKPPSK